MRWRSALLCLLLAGAAAPALPAPEAPPLDAWLRLPVLDNGRIKPVDTYARGILLGFSGKSTYQREPAARWLARVLFTPETTRDDTVFLINNPEVAEALGIESDSRARYSYAQLEPSLAELSRLARAALATPEEMRSPVDNELMRLFSNLNTYQRLRQSFDSLVPRAEFDIAEADLRRDLDLPQSGSLAYLDILRRQERVNELVMTHRGTPAAERTAYQQDLFRVAMIARMWSQQRRSLPPAIIPLPGRDQIEWIGVSDVLAMPAGPGLFAGELDSLGAMAKSYADGEGETFDQAAEALNEAVHLRLNDGERRRLLEKEVSHNLQDPFYRSEILYGLAFLAALLGVAYPGRWTYRAALVLAVAALLPHTYGIISRMIIMGRPPVTNLYSTFIFVSWCCALLGLAVEYFQKNRIGIITAGAMGLALLLTSRRFAADGDTMGVMVAVLDSNFWLATHVVTITIGYAGCAASGLLGHIYLLQALRRRPDDPVLRQSFQAVYGSQAFGLIFAFLGTMLGGVWADQSWGRFWGWDPKENGALVIVLWSAILFHARLAGMIGSRGFAAGSVLGVIWVLLAWLGVNLLSVGLHSYGFTSGVALGLGVACAAEILFVLAVTPFSRRADVDSTTPPPSS